MLSINLLQLRPTSAHMGIVSQWLRSGQLVAERERERDGDSLCCNGVVSVRLFGAAVIRRILVSIPGH